MKEDELTGKDRDGQDKEEEMNHSSNNAFIFHSAFNSYPVHPVKFCFEGLSSFFHPSAFILAFNHQVFVTLSTHVGFSIGRVGDAESKGDWGVKSMAEITKPTKGTKYIVRFFAIFLGIALLVTLAVWLMSLLAGR
ncbi:MAG TPA: hypothetical protein VF553_12100 [Pyrinomonadaceae bacterium]|jgi:hypothetical protein